MRCSIIKKKPYLLILGVVIILLLSIGIPTILAFYLSFFEYTLGESKIFVGLKNYIDTLHDSQFWNSFYNNFLFLIFAVSLELIIGLSIATILSRGFKLQKLWFCLIIAPYAISPIVAVVTWKDMLSTSYGVINYFLSFIGIQKVNWIGDTTLAMVSVILVNVWKFYPFITIISYAAIKAIPLELLEAAKIDGASSTQRFWYITWPLIKPALLIALTFRTIFVFRTFDIPWVLTHGGPVRSTEILSLYLYQYGFAYWNFGRASSIAVIMLLGTSIFAIPYLQRMRKEMIQ